MLDGELLNYVNIVLKYKKYLIKIVVVVVNVVVDVHDQGQDCDNERDVIESILSTYQWNNMSYIAIQSGVTSFFYGLLY